MSWYTVYEKSLLSVDFGMQLISAKLLLWIPWVYNCMSDMKWKASGD